MRTMVGLLVHKDAGGQPISAVQQLSLYEVLDWVDLLGEVAELIRPKKGVYGDK